MHPTLPCLLSLLVLAVSVPAGADDKPARSAKAAPITLIVPFSHGGPTDDLAQVLGEALGRALGRKVVERNVIGAGGTLAAERVAHARPDGNTLLLSNIGHASAPALHAGLRYRPVEDFAPIGLVAEVPMTLVARRALPAQRFAELGTAARSGDKMLTYGHAGPGSASHLCGLVLMSRTRTAFAGVQYPGTVEAVADLQRGRVDLMCDQLGNTRPAIAAGRIKPLAVTSAARLPELPEVPTLAESGLPGVELIVWHGLYAPAGTPPATVEALAAALRRAVQDPQLIRKLAALGARPVSPGEARPAALAARLGGEIARWRSVIGEAPAFVR